jgi:hypothetical protein
VNKCVFTNTFTVSLLCSLAGLNMNSGNTSHPILPA